MSSNQSTAGSAEHFWFETQTGILHLIELLDEDSDVLAVAFQLHGTKGWDDVGVRLRDGRTQLLQMKHTRAGDRLTFGDLVATPSGADRSLLQSLAQAWKTEVAARGKVECVLRTNRTSGTHWREGRPPLQEFITKLQNRIGQVSKLRDVSWQGEDLRYAEAWVCFRRALGPLESSEAVAFLKAFRVETDAPDLNELEWMIRRRLGELTGLPPTSTSALYNALIAELQIWTCHTRRNHEWIDGEEMRRCLSKKEVPPPWLGHCEVETPEPFLQSRYAAVDDLRRSLLADSSHKVDFLSAEPGSGKTSCISKLTRVGASLWRERCVSIRFYAYRPARPGRPHVNRDIGEGVTPEALWGGLLWQIRDNLRRTRTLAELHVPVWIDGMPWQLARDHVFRIADALGSRWQRPFVVCIDGLDHAARARRKGLREFLETLPSPDAVPRHVRFLLGGQPADAYPEYPSYLHRRHPRVRVHPLGALENTDVLLLWREARPLLSSHADDAIVRMLVEAANRRTLPTVYAVEDIRGSETLEEAARLLRKRPLQDSLHNYYESIWSAAARNVGNATRLAAVFTLLDEHPTGALMASAFPDVGKGAGDWKDELRRLRPLIRETEQGFEPLHNDLRVHLDAVLAQEPFACRDAASALADHYRNPASNRRAAHSSLLDLLTVAGRHLEFARDFTVDWIIEASASGIAGEKLENECAAAFEAAVAERDWLRLHAVACASLTLYRLQECLSNSDQAADPNPDETAPAFLRIEGEPRPFELWSAADLSELVSGCQELVSRNAEFAGSSQAVSTLKISATKH